MSRPSAVDGEGIDVPSYFLCPISLQIMRDPVALPTGITYDRESIERWIFAGRKKGEEPRNCPVTKQPLPVDADLTPNHILRHLIQAWCVAHAAHGVERFPTPRPPVDKAQIVKLLDEARAPQSQLASLRKLRAIVGESERNKRCAKAAGAPDFLVSVIRGNNTTCSDEEVSSSCCEEITSGSTCEEAICVLHSLHMSPRDLCELAAHNGDLVELLTSALKSSNYESRAHAIFLMKPTFEALPPVDLLRLRDDLFEELVKMVRDRVSYKATKAALQVLARICPLGKNRIRATDSGGVAALVQLLMDEKERSVCEVALVVMEQLCGWAEGRAELLKHPAGLAVVSKKILRVSLLATDRAVRVLHSVSKCSATPAVLQEMLQVGVVSKLCLLLQVDCGGKVSEKAKEMLRLHHKTWKSSPCIFPQQLASYPSH